MQYALGTKTEPTGEFSTAIPTATDAGKYHIWYKAVGDAEHGSTEPQHLEKVVSIAPMPLNINTKNIKLKIGDSMTLTPKIEKNFPAVFTYECFDENVAMVYEDGVVTGISEGIATIYVNASLKYSSPNYKVEDGAVVIVEVQKWNNPMTLMAKKVKIKSKDLKKKSKSISQTKAFDIHNDVGDLSYKLVSAKNGKKSFKNKFSVNAKTGKITIKKGLKKGTYKVKVKVKSKGNAIFKDSPWKAVTFKVQVK